MGKLIEKISNHHHHHQQQKEHPHPPPLLDPKLPVNLLGSLEGIHSFLAGFLGEKEAAHTHSIIQKGR